MTRPNNPKKEYHPGSQYNHKQTYALVDEQGKKKETFRTKIAATQLKSHYERLFGCELEIVQLRRSSCPKELQKKLVVPKERLRRFK